MAGLGIFGAGFAALTSKAWAQAMPTGSASNEAVARPTGPSGPYSKTATYPIATCSAPAHTVATPMHEEISATPAAVSLIP